MNSRAEHEDEQEELNRLLARARPVKNELADLDLVKKAVRAEQQNSDKDSLRGAELAFEKWRLIHKYVHARPFALGSGLARSKEWSLVAQKYAGFGDVELDHWLQMQIDVAQNRENGISDLRERRDGPVYLVVLEYIANKKRTALAILHWAKNAASD